MVFSDSLLINIFSIPVITAIVIVLFYKKRYRYWKDLNVECMEPKIPFGHSEDVIFRRMTNGEWLRYYYNYLKRKQVKYGGFYFFFIPTFFPIDLDLIKSIMQTDFAHFTDHVAYVNEKDDPLSAHLFSLNGQKWKNLRSKLTPTFTSGKIKNMFPIVLQTSEELVNVLQKEYENGNPFESKDISARFTTDVIGACGFGLDCNSLANPNTEFRVAGKRLFQPTFKEALLNFFAIVFPKTCKFFGVRIFPKPATDFFWKIIKETVVYREATGFRRNDAMQLLLDMKNKEDGDDKLTYNELAAQAFIFFFAGFETSSSLMSFALLELAINQDVQNRLREDVNTALKNNNNEFTYTSLQEIKYLDMVVNETFRKYATLPGLSRCCTKDYHVPDSNIILKKGTNIFIPVDGIHYDPEYYPDPEKFDPTRFSEENKNKRHQFTFLPFGEGPRICIGIRFGIMQIKVGLAAVIKNFKITVNPRTPLPVKIDPGNGLTSALGDVLLDLERVK